jgi:hypothetical protein
MPPVPLIIACKYLLEPVARLLIRSGVSWAEFSELSKLVFVKVARQDHGLQGRPTNTARVSILTGLSRREVTRLKNILIGSAATASAPTNRISQILSGWHVDPEFLQADGSPAELALEGEVASYAALLRRYAGDMPHGALAKEMESLGLVVATAGGRRVAARDYIRSPADPDMLRQASIALHDHAATVVHNVDANRDGPALFERMASQVDLSTADAAEFQEFVAVRGQEFLEEADRWLEERAERVGSRNKPRVKVRTGIGLYLIYDESHGSQDDE